MKENEPINLVAEFEALMDDMGERAPLLNVTPVLRRAVAVRRYRREQAAINPTPGEDTTAG